MANLVTGLFADAQGARSAHEILREMTRWPGDVMLMSPDGLPLTAPTFKHRPECLLRWALWGALVGALLVEVPGLITVLLAPIDVNVKVLLASTIWKFGAFLGATVGMLLGQEHGLEPETAERYERHLAQGGLVMAAAVRDRDLPQARGVLLESGASDVRGAQGSFEPKAGIRTGLAPVYAGRS